MMKSTLSIVAFTLTFGFSVVLVGILFGFPHPTYDYPQQTQTGCTDKTGVEIERFIADDVNNGNLGNSRISRTDLTSQDKDAIIAYSRNVRNYVRLSDSMDDSNLPSDFRAAWRDHMNAWKDYSKFLEKRKKTVKKLSETEFSEIDNRYDQRISATWYKTLRIGRSHGANY